MIELLDVVALGSPGRGPRAAGHGTGRVAQSQVFEHRRRGLVTIGGQREEGAGARIGEHPEPGPLPPGELARHLRRDRCGALEQTGRIGGAQESEGGNRDVEAEALRGHADPLGIELGVELELVAQSIQRERTAGRRHQFIHVVRDLGALPKSLSLRCLDRPGGLVESLPVGEDLGDRTPCGHGADAARRVGRDRDLAWRRRRCLKVLLFPASEEADQSAEQSDEAVDGDVGRPRGDSDVQQTTGLVGEVLGFAQHALEPPGGKVARREEVQRSGQMMHCTVSREQFPPGDSLRDAQGDRRPSCLEVALLGDLADFAGDKLCKCPEPFCEGGRAAVLGIPDTSRGGAQRGVIRAVRTLRQSVPGERRPRVHDAQPERERVQEALLCRVVLVVIP
ncbi:hypothetical protein [Brachybacterium alimentarium]|uniref:hypothetical protein n=1 Tax=Brachybacterium alimentarium TaxID=47845 RepID=UPI0031DFEF69